MGQKQPQQLKLLIGQRHSLTLHRDDALLRVQYDAPGPQHRLLLRPAAPQHRLDAGHQFHDPEGLGQIVVRPQIQTLYLVVLCALGGGHHHRDAPQGRRGPHPAQQLHAVHAGQHHIQHHQLRLLLRLEGLPEGGTVGKATGLEASGTQGVYFDIPDTGIVLHAPDHVIPPCAYR